MPANTFSVSNVVISAMVGFLFAVIGLVVSQAYQRWLERRTLATSLLTEVVDILDMLQLYQEKLDMLVDEDDIPEIGLAKEDMQIFMSNTAKIGLLDTPTHLIRFYSRVRRINAGAPIRELGLGYLSNTDGIHKQLEDVIMVGHWVVNLLANQVPKSRLGPWGGGGDDVAAFRRRWDERLKGKGVGTSAPTEA